MHKIASIISENLYKIIIKFLTLIKLLFKHCLRIIGYILLLIYCLWPDRFATNYKFIPETDLFDSLDAKTMQNISQIRASNCDYIDIINENQFMYKKQYQTDIFDNNDIKLGGEFMPECTPIYSTAIIVPYRQREKQLNQFLIYMHNFLRKQNIHYRIFVVEQFDQKSFNRAKLLNIGSVYAEKYPCLILHDVDLMPMNLGQIYACSKKPRHMCASLDEFRFNLPYAGLFGGAVAIDRETFVNINGMSNMFHGWGGEDDDLFGRLESRQIDICRFPPKYSQYTMLKHTKEKKNKDRLLYLRNGPMRYHVDGLNSLVYEEKSFKLHNLFTHILVET